METKLVYWLTIIPTLLILLTTTNYLQAKHIEPFPLSEPLTLEGQAMVKVLLAETPHKTANNIDDIDEDTDLPPYTEKSESIKNNKTNTFYTTSLNLGLVNGATVGMGWNKPGEVNRDHTIYASYYYSELLWYSGVGFENKFYNNKNNFYTLITGGIDCGEIEELFGSIGGNGEVAPPKSNFYIVPHLTFGAGYRMNVGKDNHLFIEWDIGFKASISNISLGMTF